MGCCRTACLTCCFYTLCFRCWTSANSTPLSTNLEGDTLKVKAQYEQAVENRNFMGLHLIERNDELCILFERASMYDQSVNLAKTSFPVCPSDIHKSLTHHCVPWQSPSRAHSEAGARGKLMASSRSPPRHSKCCACLVDISICCKSSLFFVGV